MKVISVTWSHDSNYNYKDSILYKSFIKNNVDSDFVNFHFNKNDYHDLEVLFEKKFGFQFEFILYKITLLKEKLNQLEDNVLIYCDTNDVVCLDNINNIKYNGGIIFSSEKNRYPNNISNWEPTTKYPIWNIENNIYLNSGLILSQKDLFIKLIESVEEKILNLDYKNFGGDQGIYTYHYINDFLPKITLDESCEYFLSTYLTSRNWFEKQDDKLICKTTGTTPIFIHDNGWNYGSPRIIEGFNLI